MCEVYPPDRVLEYISRLGLESTGNKRTRVTWLEELAAWVEREGGVPPCMARARVLPLVARAVGERDNSVRNAAVQCCGTAYRHLGVGAWKALGPMGEREASVLEDKFKHVKVVREEVSDRGRGGGGGGGLMHGERGELR